MRIPFSLAFLLLIVACATNPPPPPEPPPPPPPVPAKPMKLKIPQQLLDEAAAAGVVFVFRIGSHNGIKIQADGEVELDEGLELSEASVRFWQAVARVYRYQIIEICKGGKE